MKNRKYKKLTTTAKRLLIKAKIANEDEFSLWNDQWYLCITNYSREESWVDEIDPWQYLYGLAQETCRTWIDVDDDSDLEYHVEEVILRDMDLSTIEAIKIFKQCYIK
ncbi:hypothetical protein [Acinetobacter phage vB_AbaM_IME512]|uniref:Phage protein n=1 Tax=Acinetobacter phage P919 TaxID=3229763 RepID=A0AB39AIU7_9CAUD|nr:hypothetical protein [Acinetobacter phage vB_AbaM_IME512]